MIGSINIKSGKAAGIDGMVSTLLKECQAAIAEPLTQIMQESMRTGSIPDDWKKGNVTPLFKKASKKSHVITDQSV